MAKLNPTQVAVRKALDDLSQKPQAYLRSTEHYDVSADGETKKDWVREVAEFGEDAYLVQLNIGSGYGGPTVVVIAGHPDEALQTADEWMQTFYYEGDSDKYEEARGSGEGPVSVDLLIDGRSNNPAPAHVSTNKLKSKLLR